MPHILYLALALAYIAIGPAQDGAESAWLATAFYFSAFVCLRSLFDSMGLYRSLDAAIVGSQIGTVLFIALAAFACFTFYLPTGLSYHTFFIPVSKSLGALAGHDLFESKDAMRNAVGEIFALFCVLPLIYRQQIDHRTKIFCLLAFLVVLATFSRRALIVTLLIFGVLMIQRGFRKRYLLAFGLLCVGMVGFSHVGYEFRGMDDQSRLHQFATTLEILSVFGSGFGAQEQTMFGDWSYVHNWWLARYHMMGILGLLVSLLITWQIFKTRSLLMLIVFAGMLVSGSVLGGFSPAQWVIIALVYCRQGRSTKAA